MMKECYRELLIDLTESARRFTVSFPKSDPARVTTRGKTTRSPYNVEALLAQNLREMAVQKFVQCFNLERCAFVLQDSSRQGLWIVQNHRGIPPRIRMHLDYTQAAGLTGRVLQGEKVVSNDILNDPRRSGRYGDKWVGSDDQFELEPFRKRCYVGTPLWGQCTDARNECIGAFYGIRPVSAFTEEEIFVFELAAQIVSFGQDRLRSWRRRAESDLRQLQLSRLWRMPISDTQKYHRLLELIQAEFPFARLLLSLIDESGHRIRGVSALGFRSDIVYETNREIELGQRPDLNLHDQEDVLAMILREKSPLPRVIKPESDDWRKVDRITAFRHQVKNPLLLVPMMSQKGSVLGVLLIELPDKALALSYHEIERLSLFVNHAGALVESHRTNERAKVRAIALRSIERKCRRISADLDVKNQAKQLRQSVRVMCEYLGIKSAILYRVDESSSVLFGETGYGLNSADILSKFVPTATSNIVSPIIPLAVRAFLQVRTCKLDTKHANSKDVSVPSALFGFSSQALNESQRPGKRSYSKKELVSVSQTSREASDFQFSSATQHVFASPIMSGDICKGVLVYSAPIHVAAEETDRKAKPFFAAIGHILSIMETTARLLRAKQKSAAFNSLALAVGELATSLPALDDDYRSTVWKSVLKDVASMFGAALSQVYCFPNPIEVERESLLKSPGKLHGAILQEVGRFVVDESELPTHFVGRVQKIQGLPAREIKIGEKRGLTQSVILSLRAVLSRDIEADESWSGTIREVTGCRSFVGLPIMRQVGGKTLLYGALTLTRLRIDIGDARAFRFEEIQTLGNIAHLISSSLAQQELIESKTSQIMEQVRKCLRWFRHDIPGMITNLGDHIRHLADQSSPEVDFSDLKELTEATRSVFLACAIVLGEQRSSTQVDHNLCTKGTQLHDDTCKFDTIERRVRLLLSNASDLMGDTQLGFNYALNGPQCKGVWETAVLYVCYALVHNAFTACLQNKANTTKSAPGNVDVTFELTEDSLTIVVTDDAGGLQGIALSTLVGELYSGWHRSVGRDHSGMGLHIVHRIVTQIMNGEFHARDIQHTQSNRIGAEFTLTIPRRESP